MNRKEKIVFGLILVLCVILIILPFILKLSVPNYWELIAHILIKIFLNAALGLSLWIMLKAGELSLGQGAFLGIGAYTTGILVPKYQIIGSLWISYLLGAIVAVVFAILLGSIVVHLRRIFFLLVTWAFGELFHPVLSSFSEPFGGAGGIMNIPAPEGLSLFAEKWTGFYYIALFFALLVLVAVWRISQSKIGLIYKGIGENDVLASFCGIHVRKYKVQVFALGCFFTGFCGGILASYFTAISPDSFTFFTSLDIIMFNLMGGMNYLAGPIIGAVILTGVNELLFAVGYYKMIVYGLLVILIICLLPGGMMSLPGVIRNKLKRPPQRG